MKIISYVLITLIFLGLIVLGCIESPKDEKMSLKIIAHGSPIHGANGIIFDSKDMLYIASIFGREIILMDPETGQIVERLGREYGIDGPDDLIFGTDGSLYWTAIITGEVGRLSSDKINTSQFVAQGANPITFSDNGRLFVALDFWGDALYEIDPDFAKPPRLIAEKLGWLNGMDWGSDGFLYGPIWSKGQVVRIDVDKGTITTVADGFGAPAAVKFDSQGHLYVADHMKGEIVYVDLMNRSKKVIASGLIGLDNLALNSRDRLFVSHAEDGSIYEIFINGTKRIVSPGGMVGPGGVAVMPHSDGESVFVADTFTIREFNGLTGEDRGIERSIIGIPGGIISPDTVSTDGDNLVLASSFDNAVQVWNPKKKEIIEEHQNFSVPINAIRFQGDLIVVELGYEQGAARIVRVSNNERISIANSSDGLIVPAGLAAAKNDLWVSDWATGNVLQLIANGRKLDTPIQVAKNLSFPEGLAVDNDGNLLVIETGARRLSRIDIKTGKVTTLAENLKLGLETIPGMMPTYMFNGVAVGPSGTIYVTGDVDNVLYRIEPES